MTDRKDHEPKDEKTRTEKLRTRVDRVFKTMISRHRRTIRELESELPKAPVNVIARGREPGSLYLMIEIPQPERPLSEVLTKREAEITRLVGKFLSVGEIALKLGIAVSTVECHLRNIYRDTGIHNRTDLALLAQFLD